MGYEVPTLFNIRTDGSHELVAPDGTSYREYYGSGWQRGLVTSSKVYDSAAVLQKTVDTQWTQDDETVAYPVNPRVKQTDICDNVSPVPNCRGTHTSYGSFGLPQEVTEYAADVTAPLRRTTFDYLNYTDAGGPRIIGLLSEQDLFDGSSTTPVARTTFVYDGVPTTNQASTAVMHDATYAVDRARGNLTSATRWDVSDPANHAKLTTEMTYDAAGNLLTTKDPALHVTSLDYTDSFTSSATNTFAYPTKFTDGDNYSSSVQYNFDFGGKIRTEGPPPANQTNGLIQYFSYDNATRVTVVYRANDGAASRLAYGPNYRETWTSVNSQYDNYSVSFLDGAGRVIAAGNYHASTGTYGAQLTEYDVMGRVSRQSNPTETTGNLTPTGDDAGGWIYTQQTYDWKGRSLRTLHETDGTFTEASYAGCGCAGGEVTTLTDEVGRQQKIYADALGRPWKTEVLNWPDPNNQNVRTVYATTETTLNARDQATNVRQTDNATGAYQETTMSYDGYGRLYSKHLPEQQADLTNLASSDHTTWTYKDDDTVLSVKDARGVEVTYGYNNHRHLVTSITFPQSLPTGVTSTANVSFEYDAAGNRTLMTDGSGTTHYNYDQLSRLTSEAKTFTGLSGSYGLTYAYNLAGEVTSIGLPFNSQEIDYDYDSTGRLSGVTGTGFNATYYAYPNQYTQPVGTFASNIGYRAWGARKSMTYGNSVSESTGYNSRLQPTNYSLSNTNYTNTTLYPYPNYTSMSWTFDYYDDGRLNHAWDTTNHWFDRAYSYDHAARLSESMTYRRAEGLTPTNPYPDPSHHVLSYDVWGNITNHTGGLYGESSPDSASYANNRRSGWSYDSQGNTTVDASYNHTFDARGMSTRASTGLILVNGQYEPVLDINETYDGDGRPSQRVQTMYKQGLCCDENGNPGDPIEDVQYSYYVRSSVLGGAVLADVGQGDVNIYFGRERIAKANGSSQVTFEHHNPATGSWVTTNGHSSDRTTNRQERDAFGGELPLSTPYGGSSYMTTKFGELLFIDGSDPFDYSSGQEVDGMPVSESQLAHMMDTGSVGGGLFVGGHYAGFLDFTGHGSMGLQYLRGDFGFIRSESWQDSGADTHTIDLSTDDAPGVEDDDPTVGVVNVYVDINLQLVNASFTPQNSFDDSPQKRSDTSGDKDIKNPNVHESGEQLSDCVKKVLGKFFNSDVLNGIRIHSDGLPWFIPKEGTGAATTSKGDIYFPQGEFNQHTIVGIGSIAHELVHIMQWRKYGDTFGVMYLAESAGQSYQNGTQWAYWGNRFERPAFEREKEIVSNLTATYGGNDPCPK